MKNWSLLTAIAVIFLFQPLFSENITLLRINGLPRNINQADGALINTAVMENLQDLNDLLNNSYIMSPTLETWVNTRIAMLNMTNTNMMVVGKRTVKPKAVRPVNMKNLSPTILKTVNDYVRINGILLVNFISTVKKDGSGTINIMFTLYNNLGLKMSATAAAIPLTRLQDRAFLNLSIKEAVITAYNMWNRYYYSQKDTASLVWSASPRTAKVYIKLLDKTLNPGKNDGIPFGSYAVLVSASNYVTLLTNISVAAKNVVVRSSLQKINASNVQSGSGNLYLDADYPNAKFTVMEDGITGKTPMLLTNLKAGDKTVIFDETPDYALKNLKTAVKENNWTVEYARLSRKGSGINLLCNVDGATVILDREISGTVSNGNLTLTTPSGIHSVTVIKDRFDAVRTNMTLQAGKTEDITITMGPKKIPGLIITPQSDGVNVFLDNNRIGATPASVYLDRADSYKFQIAGTNMGYYNIETNIGWEWSRDNNLLTILKPLFGDVRVFSTPDESSVAVDDFYRGKTSAAGLALYQVPAKVIRLRVEKDGYRTLTTNVYISPNVENKFNITLKNAPAAAFVTTTPEKGFEVYVNDDYAGLSGEGSISLEFGSVIIKVKKRGFKTMSTNIAATNKNPIVINFATSPGEGEDDFIEKVSAIYRDGMVLVDNYDLDAAIKKFREARGMIDGSGLEDLPSVKELSEKVNFQLNRYSMLSQVNELADTGDLRMDKEQFDDAISNYQEALKLLDKSEIIKFNQNVKDLRKDVFKKYKNAERLKIRPNKWWPAMTRSWSGFAFDLLIADISRYGPSVLRTKLNLPFYFKARWVFIPIMDIHVGGMFNFWYMNPYLLPSEQYLPYALQFGAALRFPLIASWAFFGEYNFTVADFSSFNVLENSTIDAGFELKFGWVGVRLFYEMGFTQNYQVFHHGFGAGFTIWLTEE